MEEKDTALDESKYWGEINEEGSSCSLKYDEIFEPKAAECERTKLHQIAPRQSAAKEYYIIFNVYQFNWSSFIIAIVLFVFHFLAYESQNVVCLCVCVCVDGGGERETEHCWKIHTLVQTEVQTIWSQQSEIITLDISTAIF